MQPLFTKNFISHYLTNFKLSNVANIRLARTILKGLVQELDSGKLESLKEEEMKSRFLNEFFGDILGFNYGNSNFWTLREEVKTKVDGSKPDGALGYFSKNKDDNDVRVVIEIKDASTNLDEKQKRKDSKSPIAQAFEYSTKMGQKCKWIIVSNFKEIRFYSSNFQGKYQVFFLKELLNDDKLKELLFFFHKDRFMKKDLPSKTEQLYKSSCLNLKENEKPKHIVDEIYTSLKRFKGLSYIDPNYISSIKPFNVLDEYVWHYSNNNLLTINPKIYNLFKYLEFSDGTIIISDKLKEELESCEVIEYEEKIDYFIKFLNHCQIFNISCIEDYEKIIIKRSNGIGFTHKHHFNFSEKEGFTKKIDIIKHKSCDCISCNFKSFDFKHLLGKLKMSKYDDDFQTLEFAYGNYLVCSNNYKEAYNIYKNLSQKIKGKEGAEVEYFLTKVNMKYLHNLVWEDKKLQDSFQIKREIKEIDLDRILYEEIDYHIDDDVRNYLIRIKEEKLLLTTEDKVEELVENITNLKQLYEDGGVQHSGSNYFHELANEYYSLQLHLNKNRIIYSVFHKYKILTSKVFKGLVESYLTKEQGLNTFNSFYLIEFIINVNPTEFQKALLKVEEIKLNDKSDVEIINVISNLFKSYFEDSLFASTYKSRILEEYLLDYQFNDEYTALVTNSFTLLSKINFSKTLFELLSKIIIAFLSIETDLAWHQLKEFGKLLNKKGDFFSSEQLITILKIAIERDKPNSNKYEGLLKEIALTLNKFYPDVKITDKQLIKRAIGNISGHSKWNYISYLLLITDEQCKSILNKEFEDALDDNFDFSFYDHLIRKKLYDHNKKNYFNRLLQDVNNSKEDGFINEFKEDGKPIFNGYYFYNFIILLNILKIDRKTDLLKVFTNISEYEKWLLNPHEYNYSKFDAKWILASDNRYILSSFQGIKELNIAVEKELKKEYNKKLSEIYYTYLIK
ncbi:type IIL restriction-modification enzyme MmeI [Tenacibaculum finnmarkense]|uniref:type IIL restriction-modification enzyme MmeI n=1 Tax=Tenacibaculum finnmarkense TaxID=2781243 RepID=UPI002301EFFC|nr:type IIL restriction-modification enzyme MmeI [Tenacibaculum finnmarkense]WCC46674.1 hypothetical protein PJH08_09885 [Tenacibaculum finnmarkense]